MYFSINLHVENAKCVAGVWQSYIPEKMLHVTESFHVMLPFGKDTLLQAGV